jgi:hypothetical protein
LTSLQLGYRSRTSGSQGIRSHGLRPPADDWHWATGEEWSYTNWRSGEPNDYLGQNECCLELSGYDKTWNDVIATQQKGWLVEYDGLTGVEAETWGAIKALFR